MAIVGVGLDQGGAADLAPFVESNSIDYTILVGDRSITQAYKVTGIPGVSEGDGPSPAPGFEVPVWEVSS